MAVVAGLAILGYYALVSPRGGRIEDSSTDAADSIAEVSSADVPLANPYDAQEDDAPPLDLQDLSPRATSDTKPESPYFAELLAASRDTLPSRLAEMLQSGDEEQRAAVRQAIATWVEGGESSKYREGTKALILHLSPDSAAEEFVLIADAVAAKEKSVVGFAAFAEQILGSLSALESGNNIDSLHREQLTQAFARTPVEWESRGAGVFVSIALAGSEEGHPDALRRLSEIANLSLDAGARSAAVVSTGLVGRVEDVVKLSEVRLGGVPNAEDGRRQADALAGIYNALTRHREDEPFAVAIYENVLLNWHGRDDLERIRLQVLAELSFIPLEGLEATVTQLALDDTSPAIAAAAQSTLDAWKKRREAR